MKNWSGAPLKGTGRGSVRCGSARVDNGGYGGA